MCSAKVPLKLLDGVTGHFQPGDMTALMGPSGCGKHQSVLLCLAIHGKVKEGGNLYLGLWTVDRYIS